MARSRGCLPGFCPVQAILSMAPEDYHACTGFFSYVQGSGVI